MSLTRFLPDKLLSQLRRVQGSPGSMARGSALGMWVAFTPTVGAQMLIVTALGMPLRANIPVAVALVWISNPFTVIPIYFGCYWLGAALMGEEKASFSEVTSLIGDRIAAIPEEGLVSGMLSLGFDVLVPMCVGSVVIATVLAVPTYFVALHLARRHRASVLREQAASGVVQVDPALPADAPVPPDEEAP